MNADSLVDLSPLLQMAGLGILIALVPLAWLWLRNRGASPAKRLRALTFLTLFLTFDLVLFGAFTRLTDSGLGCPDWPGCYGNASPLGAHAEIRDAQAAMPTGPVTHGKAWVEMVHRYLATAVGVLILVLMVMSWTAWMRGRRERRRSAGVLHGDSRVSPWWATATLAWVCVQGAFGAFTVTLKLYPAIVTAHLLGGLALVALLAAQGQGYVRRPLRLSRPLGIGVAVVFALAVAQMALGGWVSTNYAVLACSDFPTCQGSFWPAMDFDQAFTLLRALGRGSDGSYVTFAALTAIHYVHRLGAYVVLVAMALLAWRLHSAGGQARRWSKALAAVALWQLASGLGNVVLGWPLAAAVAHTGGAAAMVAVFTMLSVRAWQARGVSLDADIEGARPTERRIGGTQTGYRARSSGPTVRSPRAVS
ncbi:MAG: cytochrome controlling protein rane protein-like protein [Rhizobacter sp.]|nr:cytochrome controlling protein rane protein-like protein [Rhizobacter sp.]